MRPRLRVGDVVGCWTLLAIVGWKRSVARWSCRCSCGTEREVGEDGLRRGQSRSCGCLRHGRTPEKHGQSRSPEHCVWMRIVQRCTNPAHVGYHLYGGRGIRVAPEWSSFQRFLADVGPRPTPGHSLDRIDNARGYEPGNVRWATDVEQARNKRNNRQITLRGETHCIAEWAEITGVPGRRIASRLHHGWDEERAVFTPPDPARQAARLKGLR